MKLETILFDRLKKVIPQQASRTVLFAHVEDNSYEICFYAQIGQTYQQCYQLAEEGLIDPIILKEIYAELSGFIRADHRYQRGMVNIYTFAIDINNTALFIESLARETRIYEVKKNWKIKYLV